jgi:hypothetical protein
MALVIVRLLGYPFQASLLKYNTAVIHSRTFAP